MIHIMMILFFLEKKGRNKIRMSGFRCSSTLHRLGMKAIYQEIKMVIGFLPEHKRNDYAGFFLGLKIVDRIRL